MAESVKGMDKPSEEGLPPNKDASSSKIQMKMSSNFSKTFNSFHKRRGFKMAFLNIASLPKKFDEINLNLSDKLLDLIAFNETRLNPTITDDAIHIDGYDLIRKDRSRTGGGSVFTCGTA